MKGIQQSYTTRINFSDVRSQQVLPQKSSKNMRTATFVMVCAPAAGLLVPSCCRFTRQPQRLSPTVPATYKRRAKRRCLCLTPQVRCNSTAMPFLVLTATSTVAARRCHSLSVIADLRPPERSTPPATSLIAHAWQHQACLAEVARGTEY